MSISSTESSAKKVHRHLPQVRVASPCSASWDAMDGDAMKRFCGSCEKHVYNLSAMTADEADELLGRTRFGICVRYYQRADGTVMTSDCSVGVTRRRKSLFFAGATVLLSALTSALGCAPELALGDGGASASDAGTDAGDAGDAGDASLDGQGSVVAPQRMLLGKIARPIEIEPVKVNVAPDQAAPPGLKEIVHKALVKATEQAKQRAYEEPGPAIAGGMRVPLEVMMGEPPPPPPSK
jgi:hypothetical protein